MRVGYQGTEGAYSEEAVLKAFPDATPVGFATFHQVFEAVSDGGVEKGVVPVENATSGSMTQTYDLLIESDLQVVGEVILRISHCLMAAPGVTLDHVTHVKSHPQALAQCDGFIARHRFEAIPIYDTAGAAAELANKPQPGMAAIASRRAAERWGLHVLADGIEDYDFNSTRFFLLSRDETPRTEGPQRTSVVFAVRHRPGSLLEAVQVFAEAGVNLTKLESRPRRDRAFSYVFYLDFEGHAEDEGPAKALLGLLRRAAFVKVLGSYPAAAHSGG